MHSADPDGAGLVTLRRFAVQPPDVPMATTWYLTDLAEARGKQELFTRQAPQRLKALRDHAIIESAVSSNRIEGVEVEPARAKTIVLGKAALRDRNEEEVAGYRDALQLIHEPGAKVPVTEGTIRQFHRLCRGEVWDAGEYKQKDADIIESYPDGRSRVRFKTVPASATPEAMQELVSVWNDVVQGDRVHRLLALAAFNLDFLCIHPFRDGNGRVSRLLLLLQSYQFGFEVGRYISLERIIEQNRERYYETLEQASKGWHEGSHDPWPYLNYVLYVLKTAYQEFEERVGQVKAPRGEKTALVDQAIARASGTFTLAGLERACPGVSRDMVRRILRERARQGKVECLGRGPGAKWRRKEGTTSKRGQERG